ncbi:MAG: mechanosensitive ion channel family protein [Planctomycetota bacterium]
MNAVFTSAPLVPGVRLVRVLWRLLTPLAIVLCLHVVPGWLGASDALAAQARRASWFVLAYALVVALSKEVLSPVRPGLRLVKIGDSRAERISNILKGLAFVVLATELAIWLIHANEWSPAAARLFEVARNAGLVLVGAALVARLGVIRRIRPPTKDTWPGLLRHLFVRIVWPAGIALALFHVVARGLGYLGLARWVAVSTGLSVLGIAGVVLAVRFVNRRLGRALHLMQAEAAEERGEAETGPSPAFVGIERILFAALKVGGWIAAIWILRRAWDPTGEGVAQLATTSLFGSGPTWGGLFGGFVGVASVILIGALVRNLLIFLVFPRIDLDAGIRYAVLTILRYVIWVVTAMMLLEVLGIDTSALAVFAGAFGVGLAFGLQDIFANFFSGLIMLLERPVRIGDTVEVGGTSGTVEAIRLRGTKIRTLDQTTVTIPNREMIGERLTNLSYDMPTARIVVNVGVGYGSDMRVVAETLLDVARRDGRILQDPEPHARLMGFGESSVDWVLRCWTGASSDRFAISSDLHRAVFSAFQRAGIEIPFPQRDLNIREWPKAWPKAGQAPGTEPPV